MPDKHRICQAEKQAAVNDGRNGQELLLQGRRISDRPEVTVEYIIAIVGDPRLAIGTAPQSDPGPQPLQGPGSRSRAKRDDLHWHRKARAELGYHLTVVYDNEAACRTGSDNFFAQQRTPSAFDQVEIVVRLIRAIHGKVQIWVGLQGGQRNGELGGNLRGLYG